MAGASEEDRVQVPHTDGPVQVHVDQAETRGGSPVPEQTRLDVRGQKRLAEERIVLEIDLPDGEIVRCAPVGVDVV
jgi:hypothetical protein